MEISRFPVVWINLKCTRCMRHPVTVKVTDPVPAWEVRRGEERRGEERRGEERRAGLTDNWQFGVIVVCHSVTLSHDARVMITLSCETAVCSHSYPVRSSLALRSPHVDSIWLSKPLWCFSSLSFLFCFVFFVCFSNQVCQTVHLRKCCIVGVLKKVFCVLYFILFFKQVYSLTNVSLKNLINYYSIYLLLVLVLFVLICFAFLFFIFIFIFFKHP